MVGLNLVTCVLYLGFHTLVVKGQGIPPAERVVAELAPQIHRSLDVSSGDLYKNLASISSPLLLKQALDVIDSGNVSISEKCVNDTALLIECFTGRQQWALKFFDAWGKLQPGLYDLATKWIGSYKECKSLMYPEHPTGNKTENDFVGKYCNVGVGPKTTATPNAGLMSLTVGVCLPDSCTEFDMAIAVDTIIYLIIKTNQIAVTSVTCQPTSKDRVKLSISAIAMICVLSFLGLWMLLGTLFDILVYQRRIDSAQEIKAMPAPPPPEVNHDAENHLEVEDYTPLLVKQMDRAEAKVQVDRETPIYLSLLITFSVYTNGSKLLKRGQTQDLGCIHGIRFLSMTWVILGHTLVFALIYPPGLFNFASKLLVAFSVYTNGKKVLSVTTATTTGRPDTVTLTCVHGVRFLSMTWVILGHTYVFIGSLINNLAVFGELLNRWTFQALLGATVSVDSFFFLSGLLVAYLCLREMKKNGGVLNFNWAMFYIHRFWRLTPPYMLLLSTMVALLPYMGSGPLWPTENINGFCNETWWTNLLYVNNLVKPEKMCMAWSWYLANDMQFFVISPLLLIPFFIKGFFGLSVTMVVMLISFIVTGIISSTNYFLPMQLSVSPYAQHLAQNHSQADMFNHLYIVPWTRIGPYLVGMVVGYLIYITDRKFKMHWVLAVLGWVLAAACNLSVLYGLYNVSRGKSGISNNVMAFYNTTQRTAWAVGLGWVVFACVNGYGGFVNTLLSWNGLVPLSRLTYMAYLVHPIVMMIYYYSLKQPLLYDDLTFIYLFFGHLVMSYMAAFVISLMFESPMLALEKVVIKPLGGALGKAGRGISNDLRRIGTRVRRIFG